MHVRAPGLADFYCKPSDCRKAKQFCQRWYFPAKTGCGRRPTSLIEDSLEPLFGSICRAILRLPMNRTVKTFIVWLLMLMLPLHAVAASVGMSCAPVRQHETSSAGMAHHQPVPGAHAHHGADHTAHAGHGSSAAADDEHGSTPDIVKKTHSSCSACSAVCAGAVAPPSAFLPLPTFDGSEAVLVSSSTLVAGFIPDGPQRPPRHPSA